MDTKDKEMQLEELRRTKGKVISNFLIIKHAVDALQQELPEQAELLDKVLDKARALKNAAIDSLILQMHQVRANN